MGHKTIPLLLIGDKGVYAKIKIKEKPTIIITKPRGMGMSCMHYRLINHYNKLFKNGT